MIIALQYKKIISKKGYGCTYEVMNMRDYSTLHFDTN
jgi:hypothetical protein